MLSRRQALAASATLAAAGLAGLRADIANAARNDVRVPYGSCVRRDPLDTEVDYRASFLSYCQTITPEGGLYWYDIRPTRQQFKFDIADAILAFAEASRLSMRGHTLVWYGAMPDWTKEIRAGEAERELTTHIERVMSHYRGKIKTWHVVNEAIDESKGGAVPGLRPNIWLQTLGDRYIDIAFRAARRVDPSAELILNDFGIEQLDGAGPPRRQAFLKLIKDLVSRGVPLNGIGLQGHLKGAIPVDRDGLHDFVSQIRAMRLSVHVTELDVIDNELPAPIAVRDAVVAARANDFLEPIFAVMRPSAIITWGITDRYTWVPTWYKRTDGLANRPLPFDENYRPKPLWSAIDYFCRKTG